MGYFVPLFDNNNIFIKSSVRSINLEEAIVSHEHVHLLQYRNGQFCGKESRCSDVLLTDEWKGDGYLLYLFEKNEVEARLHEIVASSYRAQGRLPLTLEGFLALLAGSNQFGSLVIKAVEQSGGINERDIIKYYERSEDVADQVQLTLLVIKSWEMRRRFITEVLTTMYGNLIRYYGDEAASLTFLSRVERPNLYDVLYAKREA